MRLIKTKFSKSIVKTGALGLLTVLAIGCKGKSSDSPGVSASSSDQESVSDDIVDVAVRSGSFTTLVKAVQAAGLEEALRTSPALTVFAPTDEAFARLPEGVLDSLLSDKEKLKTVLLYHVVGGVVPSTDAVKLTSATMLNSQTVSIKFDGTTLMLNDSKVIATDVKAKNGIIHVIDRVLIPSFPPQLAGPAPSIEEPVEELKVDVISVAESAGVFKTLLTAVRAAGLESTLREAKDITLFAPTDEAFAKIPEETLNAVLADKELLTDILLYHVVGARVESSVAVTLTEATMLNGKKVKVNFQDGVLKINDSKVMQADVNGGNGLIHVVDAVLLP